MKTIVIAEFTRHFRRYKKTAVLVKHRDQVVGTWTPVPDQPAVVDFEARVKKDFTQKLPFNLADLLKEEKKR